MSIAPASKYDYSDRVFLASLNASREQSGDTAESAPVALKLKGVSLAFGGVTAVSNIDLTAASGEIRSIIGPNGAGKSSLLNVISGIYRAQQGEVWIGKWKFARVRSARLAHLGVARTFQNLALFSGLSVLENIALGRSAAGRANFMEQLAGFGRARRERDDALARSEAIIDFLDLRAVRDRLAGILPYGLQKRVELARALVARPKILLLDEPMAGMTATEKTEMAQFIRAARDTFGTTVVLIEHDIAIVMGLSDRGDGAGPWPQDRGWHASRGAGRPGGDRRLRGRRARRRTGGR